MGFASIYGWTVILGGTALGGVACLFALRFAASAASATPGWAWVVPAAAVAATTIVSLACRAGGLRIAISHERPLPEMLTVAVVVCGALACSLRWSGSDSADRGRTAALRAMCLALVLIPVAVWIAAVPVPAWRTERENRIRADYDEAVSATDVVRARQILEASPWLRHEIEHALDGTVPAHDGTVPADVARFVKQREGCDHFRSEEAYDTERKRFLIGRMTQLCTGTDASLRALRLKYKAQPGVLATLERFEDRIE